MFGSILAALATTCIGLIMLVCAGFAANSRHGIFAVFLAILGLGALAIAGLIFFNISVALYP